MCINVRNGLFKFNPSSGGIGKDVSNLFISQ